jgi:hypothetical protein
VAADLGRAAGKATAGLNQHGADGLPDLGDGAADRTVVADAGVEPTAAATTASVTMRGRRAVVDTATTSKMPNLIRPVFDADRCEDPAVLIATITSSP